MRTMAILVAVCSLAQASANAHPQMNQQSIAQQVLSEDVNERSRGVEAAMEIGPSKASPELRAALISALTREAGLHREHYRAQHVNETVPPLESPEVLGRLTKAVADLKDPASIPALTSALGSGFTVNRALAAFGEQAAPAVLDVVESPQSIPDAINHGLITLRFMVEGSRVQPLRAATLKQMRRTAAQKLKTGKGLAVTTLWWAIDLAAVLNDSALRRSIQVLATDWNEVAERGITDPDLIEQTQRRAADRLAGIPPLPRP